MCIVLYEEFMVLVLGQSSCEWDPEDASFEEMASHRIA